MAVDPNQMVTVVNLPPDESLDCVRRKLALDLGGVHNKQEGTIEMDSLGLTEDSWYALDMFQAERQPVGSNFKIETSIACFVPVIE